MTDVNIITVEGRITKNAELKICKNGSSYFCRFSIANHKDYKNNEGKWETKTSFFYITSFISVNDKILELLTKGSCVIVTGSMRQDEYGSHQEEKQKVWKIEANSIRLLHSYPSSDNYQHSFKQQQRGPSVAPASTVVNKQGQLFETPYASKSIGVVSTPEPSNGPEEFVEDIPF